MILTGEFIKMLSEDTSWTTGEDFGSDEDVLLRKNCARIIHRYLQRVISEPDETEGLPSPADIPDMNDCRICAPHIAQVIAKKIMEPRSRGTIMLFGGNEEVSREDALLYVRKVRRGDDEQ